MRRCSAAFERRDSPREAGGILGDLATELTGGRLPVGEATAIHARYRGNLRDAFRELHDRWAGG